VRLLKVIQGHAFRSPSQPPRLELGCLLGAAALLIRLVLQGPQGVQPLSGVDNSDFSPGRLTFLSTLLILAWYSPSRWWTNQTTLLPA